MSSSPESSGISNYVKKGDGKHIIGVAVYNVKDDEVAMFHRYLVKYIAGICFDDVEFVYSGSITSEDELIGFIDDVAALGGEGIMSFYNIDLYSVCCVYNPSATLKDLASLASACSFEDAKARRG